MKQPLRRNRRFRRCDLKICVICVPLFWNYAQAQDCNLNGVDDLAEIRSGASADCNQNGTPDLCELVPHTFGTVGAPLASRGEPQVLTSGDLDSDGIGDVVVGTWLEPNGTLSRLSIFLSRNPRDFAPELGFETANLFAVEIADPDGDGDLDLVTLNAEGIQLYPNLGPGGAGMDEFGGPLQLITSPELRELAVRDLDLDGRADLMTVTASTGSMTWYRNLGEAPLGEAFRGEGRSFEVFRPLGSLTEAFLVASDFDGDGDVDAALASSRTREVSVLENTEGGKSFSVAHSLPLGGGFVGALVDADVFSNTVFSKEGDGGDGPVDLVGESRGQLVLWRNLGEAGFEGPLAFGAAPESLGFSDFDRDGTLDFLVANRETGVNSRAASQGGVKLELFRGLGDGRFLRRQALSAGGTLFRADDLDGDGDTDLAVAARDETTVLFQGERSGLVFEGVRYDTRARPHFADFGNFNGDEFLDVVTANADAGTYTILFGRSGGTFKEATLFQSGGSVQAGVAADLDLDGDDDLVFRRRGRDLLVRLNQGGGEFGDIRFEPTGFASAFFAFLTTADIDGDGRTDVLFTGPDSLAVSFGDGIFDDGQGGLSERLLFTVGTDPLWAAAGDLDADGDLDLVSANSQSADVSLLFQEQSRRFAPAVSVPVEGGPRSVAFADFDQDGDLDAVTANSSDLAVLINPGDGRLVTTSQLPGGGGVAVTVADLDLDGLVDVIATSDGASMLTGRGDGTFSRRQHFPTSADSRFTLAGDLDFDGDVDLVVANRADFDVSVLLNQLAEPASPEEALGTVCTELDFELVSVPDALREGAVESDILSERRTSFFLPVREDATLLSTLFVNVARFPRGLDFLRQVFPERFGDLSEMGFADLALRRSSRDYFIGAVRRLRLDDGSTAYGFDVQTDAAGGEELLSLEETRRVYAGLRESFFLEPLVYAPTTAAACEAAQGWMADLPVVLLCGEAEPPPGPVANPTFFLEIPADALLCGVSAVAGVGRGPHEEHELKSFVRLRQGRVTLPSAEESFSAELFEEVLFGPERLVAEPQESGTFRVVRIPGQGPADQGEPVTTYRFTYSQPFTLPPTPEADGRLLELEILAPFSFGARGEVPLTESVTLPEEFFVVLKGREPLRAKLDGEPLVRYGSCTYDVLPLWEIEAELEDGTLLRLEERFEEAASLFDTAPASVGRAEVTLEGERRVVTDYFDLVYSSTRHNRAVDYWVTLRPPVVLEGIGTVHIVELQAPEDEPGLVRPAQAAFLGADFGVLAMPPVTRFERAPLAERLFVRGDSAGDGALDVLDAVGALRYIFERGETVPCAKAADANDDGRVNIVDPILVVSQLFRRGDGLPEPFPDCGTDPTEDTLSCRSTPSCP